MTLTQLPTTPQETSCLAAGLDALHTLISDLQAATPGPGDAALLGEVDRARTRLDALRLRVIAAASASDVPAAEGLATTADWVARRTRATRQDSARDASLATTLAGTPDRPGLTGTRAALDHGDLSAAHARVIADAVTTLPAGLTPDQNATCEAKLVELAGRYDPAQLRRVARRVIAEVEPDPDVVDAHENTLLVAEEDSAYDRARLTFHDNGDGTTSGHFTLPTLQSTLLAKVIDAMTAPRRTRSTRVPGRDRQPDDANPLVRDHHDPRRDPAHARGLAFAQLLEHLPTDHLHGATTAQVNVLLDIDSLRGSLKAAGLDTDHPISGGEARRLACTAGIFGTVFGRGLAGKSLVLDLGRKFRLFNDAQRAAITALHTHCAARGCSRPVAWCELHHRVPWSRGGTTDLENAVPLCGWHHRRVHDHRHRPEWHPDGTLSLVLRT